MMNAELMAKRITLSSLQTLRLGVFAPWRFALASAHPIEEKRHDS